MSESKLSLLTLKLLGFICKPWKNYPKAWWFDGRVVLSDLSDIKDFPELIRVCMIQYTPEGWSGSSDNDRRIIVHDLLQKVMPK